MCSENVGDTEEIIKEVDGSGEPKTKLLILYAFSESEKQAGTQESE